MSTYKYVSILFIGVDVNVATVDNVRNVDVDGAIRQTAKHGRELHHQGNDGVPVSSGLLLVSNLTESCPIPVYRDLPVLVPSVVRLQVYS